MTWANRNTFQSMRFFKNCFRHRPTSKLPRWMYWNSAGLTLLEMMLAMGFISVALFALSGLASVGIHGASTGKKITVATTLAQEKLEELMADGFAHGLAETSIVTEPYGAILQFPLYKRTWKVISHSPFPGMQIMTVTVLWGEDDHAVKVMTIVTE